MAGRPTKYKPEYCQMLVDYMAQGLSFDAFAANIDVDTDTLYEWVKVHSAFSDAKKLGNIKRRETLEKIAIAGMTGKIPNYNATMCIFMLKNCFPQAYRDRQEIEHTVVKPKLIISLPDTGEKHIIDVNEDENTK